MIAITSLGYAEEKEYRPWVGKVISPFPESEDISLTHMHDIIKPRGLSAVTLSLLFRRRS
ncbi:hypothetical protein N7491_008009 [Penicillium cf. griseofulvum]|uniref:Uncharacterized protein n=1 Tax=Penicillium cf. griseofulvum TaxID=2972120 RepID=A0A9W9J401_9EURO|nr:hypothetical protein N7472_008964 [Penicillium cf. griseofulvum]KAJ5427567.1 hypothetical protein N7491_008009 [Penicillium cf. griseofulvum]KAJ5431764.1 hypothetical protein N7445_008262 [Penicillium cf. griseofulvum]